LLSTGAYIAEDSPSLAAAFVLRIIEAVERLGTFPSIGRVVPEASNDLLRELILQNYRIVYVIAGETVMILAVVNAAMDMTRRLDRLSGQLP
jgi:toxin ParE1/3/4